MNFQFLKYEVYKNISDKHEACNCKLNWGARYLAGEKLIGRVFNSNVGFMVSERQRHSFLKLKTQPRFRPVGL